MSTPHKHAAVIHAWADGEAVQYRVIEHETWNDVPADDVAPSFGNKFIEWRIKPKPETLTYRVALMQDEGRFQWLELAQKSFGDEEMTEQSNHFVRWLSDRITVEV